MKFSESHVEDAALSWLAGLGYAVLHGPDISPDGPTPERISYDQVFLTVRLREALECLNPHLPAETLEEVLRKVQQTETPLLIEENRRLHRYLIEGVPVEVAREDGSIGGDVARLIDFDDVDANDWLAVNQYTVVEHGHNRRPDVVLFVNGLPLAVIELKNPGDESATLEGAFNQLQTYKDQIPSLFRTNAVLVTSDGLYARVGSLTANPERFMPWRAVDGSVVAPKGVPELETLIEGVFEKTRFLALIRDFTVFGDTGSGIVKIVAGYHQFHAVRHAVVSTATATSPDGDRRIGVIWHTQGSGKSLLMAFYAGQIIAHPAMENPTIVVITDRNDLDDQLFGTFAMCRDLLRQTPQQADSREDLQKVLTRPSGGVVFTTIQKFAPEHGETDYPVLTDRRNVVVIADEAHRSQYGFRAKVARKTGEISYGFAKYLRDALPNASFIGFTGTPIEQEDVNTPAVFGEYIDVYDINRGVEDGATVPIYYESRIARIELDEDEKPHLDDEVAELTEDEAEDEQEKLKRKWANVEAVVGAEKRLAMVANDLVEHFENRVVGMDGKAMIVCMSRRICVALYNKIIKLRPEWHSDDDESGVNQDRHDRRGLGPEGMATAHRRQGAPGTARQAGEGPRRFAQAGDRPGHVAHRLRRAEHAHDVYRQTHAGARAHAGDRASEPRIPRQASRSDRGLHRYCPEPEIGARPVFWRRPATRRHRRGRGRRRYAGEARNRVRHVPRFQLPEGAYRVATGTARGACRRDRVGPRYAAARVGQGVHRGGQEASASPVQGCRPGALQGIRPRGGKRRGAGYTR